MLVLEGRIAQIGPGKRSELNIILQPTITNVIVVKTGPESRELNSAIFAAL